MTTTKAIKYLKEKCWGQIYMAAPMRLKDVESVISALKASQKREREMFKKMAINCVCCQHTDMGTCSINNNKQCTKRNCPLLKGGWG